MIQPPRLSQKSSVLNFLNWIDIESIISKIIYERKVLSMERLLRKRINSTVLEIAVEFINSIQGIT